MQSAPFRYISTAVTMTLLVALVAAIGLAVRDHSHIALAVRTPTTQPAPTVVEAAPVEQETQAQTESPVVAAQNVLTDALSLPTQSEDGDASDESAATLIAATAAPTSTTQSTRVLIALGSVERVAPGGFSFQALPDYEVEVTGSAVNMQAVDADPAIGPVFLLSGGPPGQFVSGPTNSLEAVFAQFVEFFASRDNFRVENQRAHTAANLNGLTADITNSDDAVGAPFAGQIFMARPGANQIFVMVGIAPVERWQESVAAEYAAVLDSVDTFVPGAQEAATAPTPSVTLTESVSATRTAAPTRGVLSPGAVAEAITTPQAALQNTVQPTATPVLVSTPPWRVLSNGNFVNRVTVDNSTAWAATDGGVVAWNMQTGAASKFTTVDGLSSNVITSVAHCPLDTLGMVFGSQAGLQLFDLRSGGWRTINSTNSPMSFDNVSALYCNVEEGFLVVGYINQGIDIFDVNAAEWTYVDLPDVGEIRALAAVDALAEIWIGADAGLLVVSNGDFSNRDVTRYSSQNSPLTDDAVQALTAAADGTVWFTAGSALYQVITEDGERQWTRFDADTVLDQSFPEGVLTGVAASDGTVWVASAEVALCQFNPQTERCIRDATYNPRQQNGLVAGPLTSLNVIGSGDDEALYYTTAGNGFSRFAADRWTAYVLEQEPLQGNRIRHMVQADSGAIWLTTNGGVQQIDPAQFRNQGQGGQLDEAPLQRFEQINSELFSSDIWVLQPDGAGGIWFGAQGAGYYDGATWSTYSTVDGLVDGQIEAMTIDKAERVWFGTAEGLSIFNGDAFFSLTEAEGLPTSQVTALLTDRSAPGNIVWIGTGGGGLLRFDKNQIQVYNRSNANLPSNTITALAQDADGSLLVGTDRGVARFSDERATTIRPIGSGTITAVAVGQNGSAWVGTLDSGVFHFNGLAWEQFSSQDNLPAQQVTTILIDQDESVWIGFANGGLMRYDSE